MVDVHAVAVLLRIPKWMLQFDRTELLRILPPRHDGGGRTPRRGTGTPTEP